MEKTVTILTESELRQIVPLDPAVIEVIEKAFVSLFRQEVTMPPVLSMAMPENNAEIDIKTAYIKGFEGIAIKVSPGFFNNPMIGLNSLNGLMTVLDARTGLAKAVLLDNGYLTNIRTGAAGGIAAKYLAPTNTTTATIFGAGTQAMMQLRAAHSVTNLDTAFICARDRSKAAKLAVQLSRELKINVTASGNPATSVAQSQLVITTTPAEHPIFKAEWIHPGLHITAMGSDQAGKHELETDALMQSDLYVVDSKSQCELLGELQWVDPAQMSSDLNIKDLGNIICSPHEGRTDDNQITICDLTGTGAQDTAIASYALSVAEDNRLGTVINTAGDKLDQA
ncbi:cyclodeaminase [Sneathiella glossodoripedis]|uniref:cyclodeaminase n=1 Tax=Sneathiella glossodoripedis TaxID=418853 RepID=UPI000472988A|nr:cyclodeaminase [Sneathiella glossodoripedis]